MPISIKLFKHNNLLHCNGYSLDEESVLYDSLLRDVYENPRWYLDNLESLSCFRVSWGSYSKGNVLPTLPFGVVISKRQKKKGKVFK